MTDRICKVEGCGTVGQTWRGMCQMHYRRWKKDGDAGEAERRTHERGSVPCSRDGCEDAAVSRGMCDRHYRQVLHDSSDRGPRGPKAATWQERFLAQVDRRGDDECWPWKGAINKQTGYGQFNLDGACVPAHRVAYEYGIGPIPDGFTIDHVKDAGCTRRDCQNWLSHLEAVTHWENNRRGDSMAARYARSETCPNDHEYAIAGVVMVEGQRRCKACWDAKQARRNAAKRRRRLQT